MLRCPLASAVALGLSAVLADPAAAKPFGPFSTCTVTITQNPARPQCLTDAGLPVARLCPSGSAPLFDIVTFDVKVMSVYLYPEVGVTITALEKDGDVNIATGGSTTAVTDSMGRATITVTRASGSGRIAACAEGWFTIGDVEVRSPDVSYTTLPSGCALPTIGTSFVNANDVVNTTCGFLAKFGAVTVGANNSWDLDCNGAVNASDVLGTLGRGGVVQHFGHGASLGAKYTCP